jgi:hypothetical protein
MDFSYLFYYERYLSKFGNPLEKAIVEDVMSLAEVE